ncbi:hypothetical protein M6D81_25265 [Paenibacillus sp. J5C_2022]|uniref:hypothetical protein n=1 Tax=Paenibacillus sp. J5C2022 TaxID=2977129 RepID=UPI0021CE1307|nr:hypothetical protein [Paenibacillus sp. J5C2022]MCU6712018.1 hypothetical protein [Paenibacillus sp. J5C2022]
MIENIGSRRELFLDDDLIHSTTARLMLQKPVKRDVCFRFDAPHEGNGNLFPVLIKDNDKYLLYYIAAHRNSEDGKVDYTTKENRDNYPLYACCIESQDGINWSRPSIGAVEVNGSTDNNIVLYKADLDNFVPFIDGNPDCPPDERFKAIEANRKVPFDYSMRRKLYRFKSADGYQWKPMSDEPLSVPGNFDSSNLAFWDAERQKYWAYVRNFHKISVDDTSDEANEDAVDDTGEGIRDIRWCESTDFQNWSEPELLDFEGGLDIPLYVSAVTPYYRAPHVFLGFPARYVERKQWSPAFDQMSDPEHRKNRMLHHPRYGLAITDCLLMSSRDGKRWRRSDDAYLTPGITSDHNWVYGDCFLTIGMQETKSDTVGEPNEISMYAFENNWKDQCLLRRYTIRQDGFMSLRADAVGHETLTKPFTFEGRQLTLNVSTSAVGGMKVELQDISGKTIPGYSLEECDEIFGDRLDYIVSWNGKYDVSPLVGQAIRMRFFMKDVDLYSFKFD